MSLNLKNLELSIIQKIDISTNEEELNTLTKVLSNLKGGFVYTVDSFTNLPQISSDSNGKLYYVSDEETIYFYNGISGNYKNISSLKKSLYGWGANFAGQIGDGTTIERSSPVQEVTSSTDWCQVSGGESHSLALKTSGTLWAWGGNNCGQIGDGTGFFGTSSPVQEITSSTDWCQVSISSDSCGNSLALKTTGTLWSWGGNFAGQIGDGTTIERSSPVQEVTSSIDWCQVSNGRRHSLALKTNNTLWAWGDNYGGKLGDGTTTDRSSPVQEVTSSTDWCQVSGGYDDSIALKTNGTLWGWGQNGYGGGGPIGDGTNISRSSPVQEVTSSTDWCQVTCSSSNRVTHAIKTSGTLWGWGSNFVGQIGDGTTISRCSPVQETTSSTNWCQVKSGYHSLALKTNNTLWAWGGNYSGGIGDGTTISRSSPVQEVTSSTNWCQVSGGLAIKVE